jgi:N-formylglutamate deformylase
MTGQPMPTTYNLQQGRTPLLVSVPHAGIKVPESIRACFTGQALPLPDTDWFVDRLYQQVTQLGAGLMVATGSRYIIDLNRPPDDGALYDTPTTGLVPLETFQGNAIYSEGRKPSATEIQERTRDWWQPWHDALGEELLRLKSLHGHAVLLDAHSIFALLPRLFEGVLPDFNLGSNGGVSSAADLVSRAASALQREQRFSFVLDGRFRGGYITRHYGDPDNQVHALQLEMAQQVYMHNDPPRFDRHRAAHVRPVLEDLVVTLSDWKPADD